MNPRLRIGASSWSAPSWEGVFYPPGTPPADYLAYYAGRLDTVEVDATFYRIPGERMVDAWRERKTITHEKLLVECAQECGAFLKVMDRLGDKLGPLLLQFRYFRKDELADPKPFLDRLEVFLAGLPRGRRYVVEVRNKSFVNTRFLDLLRRNGAALALIDHPWFFDIEQLMRKSDVLTAEFAYVRWLGDRKAIEHRTTRWDRLIVDRRRDMGRWIPAIRTILDRGLTIYGYFNNHYAGYAIGSIDTFRSLWDGSG
ncbi:MAG: hypothetical protein DMF51_08565 [Acidobacteria bacterium]|nr:MAG: hypothetical protein DMF51_08565 [Acidobacteriota bacterium]